MNATICMRFPRLSPYHDHSTAESIRHAPTLKCYDWKLMRRSSRKERLLASMHGETTPSQLDPKLAVEVALLCMALLAGLLIEDMAAMFGGIGWL